MTAFSVASDVRAFALANGLPCKPEGTRGRIPLATIEAFNDANPKAKYRTGAKVPAKKVEVKGKNAKGRTVTKRVVVSEARATLRESGVEVNAKGRLSADLLRQAAGLV